MSNKHNRVIIKEGLTIPNGLYCDTTTKMDSELVLINKKKKNIIIIILKRKNNKV